MAIEALIGLIILGVFLLIVEFLLVPGITIAGIGGIALIIAGVFFAYHDHRVVTGHYTLLGTFILLIATTLYVFRAKTWKRITLEDDIDSKVDNIPENTISKGDVGKTISRLAPIGKIEIKGLYLEAK
jgi:membrane-bound ClpP family serine protease